MKLHLTASSERGKEVTKSGNNYLALEITNDKRETIADIVFYPDNTYKIVKLEGEEVFDEPKTVRENICEHGINLNTDDCGLWHR